jgi:hypothetical protein
MMQSEAERECDAVRRLWIEWLVTRQLSTGDGEPYMTMAGEPPAWFRRCELGLAVLEGPSVFWTMANLPRINRKHRKLFARGESASELRDALTPEQRQKKLRARLKLACRRHSDFAGI